MMIQNWFLNYKKNGFFFQEHDDDFIDVDGQYSNKKDVIVLVNLWS